MKICMILDRDFPPDIRVENEIFSLLEAGHDIHLIAMNKSNQCAEEYSNGIKIHRLKWVSILPHKVNRWANMPHILNLRWLYMILSIIKKYSFDAIHVHDLPLAPFAIIVGKLYNIPVVFDNHEYYPAFLRSIGYRGVILTLLYSPPFFDLLDRFCKKRAHFLICTVEESKPLLMETGVPPEKICVVMNTVNLKTFLDVEIESEVVDKYKSYYTMTYIGGFGKHRNIELPIRALPYVIKNIPNLKLLIVGGDDKRKQILVNLASEFNVDSYVEFTGWVHQKLIPSYIQASNICILPHLPNLHTNTTTPNKLFQYMALAKPIIGTPIVPVKRIVEETQCGIIVSHANPQEFADAVIKLYKNEAYAKRMGENGRQAILKKYNWSQTSSGLVRLYENITSNTR